MDEEEAGLLGALTALPVVLRLLSLSALLGKLQHPLDGRS